MPRLPLKKPPTAAPPTVPLALFLLLVCGGAFFGLMAMVFPGAGMLGLVLMLLGLFFVAQYYVWGRWLYAWAVKKEQQAEAIRSPNSGVANMVADGANSGTER